MRKYLFLSVLLSSFVSFSQISLAEPTHFIQISSPHSVSKTADKLVQVITKKGLALFARVNHAKGARNVGMDLAPSVMVLFGNPKIGTPLMQSNPKVGLDLPLRVLIWQDAQGTTQIGYHDPMALKKAYQINDQDKIFNTMTGALKKLTAAAARP